MSAARRERSYTDCSLEQVLQSRPVSPISRTIKIQTSFVSLARRNPLTSMKITVFSDATTGIAISSNIEAGLGIMAGSLITLRPLMRWLRDVSHRVLDTARGVSCSSNRTQTLSVEQKHTSPDHGRSDIEAAVLSPPSQAEEPQFGSGAI